MAVRDVVQAAAGVGGGGEYVEDVFSTYLYTGTSSTQTITNGIDLDGEGGLVWFKCRSLNFDNALFDSERGNAALYTNTTQAEEALSNSVTLNSDGFSLGSVGYGVTNSTGHTYASWSFRKAPKFFDIVTYTGNGVAGRTVAHNLGSEPGFMLVKATSTANGWNSYHRSLGATYSTTLNSANASYVSTTSWNSTAPTSTEFTLGTNTNTNANGVTYVAYLFAHDAGGFGDDGEQNVISCGSYTTNGNGEAEVNLGWEAQFTIIKQSDGANDWRINDSMRGAPVGQTQKRLLSANTASAESADSQGAYPTATGFAVSGHATFSNYIYIAIRRPMKTPESGTEVFSTNTATYSANQVVTTGFPVDMLMMKGRTITFGNLVYDRLRGLASTNTSPYDAQLLTSDTSAESSGDYTNTANNTGYQISPGFSGFSSVNWNFRRAPGFMDVVCYTGTGVAKTEAHNLGVVPELMIVKKRNSSTNSNWATAFVESSSNVREGYLNLNVSLPSVVWASSNWGSAPTSTLFSVGGYGTVNGSADTFIAYVFATLPGVSKVGSYVGTGANLNVDCGFSAGARFILIKRTDSTGDWYVWDSARGIVSGNDPYLLLNSTAAEVTTTDYIDPLSSGFTVTSSAPAALNASGGTYIFLAIA